jgi:hypothetical protein
MTAKSVVDNNRRSGLARDKLKWYEKTMHLRLVVGHQGPLSDAKGLVFRITCLHPNRFCQYPNATLFLV